MKKFKHISQSELESYLWSAATLLRGYIDAGDYKQFIFPLLFYKRLCDVYDEELAVALEESGGDQEYAALPEQHRFQIPEDTHWKATRAKVKNVGKAIQDALRTIETANPDTLHGVFGDAQWTNKDRLPDHMLRELIEHFSSQTLSLSSCPEDELGVGYEFLIKKFADDSGHTAAEFYTNRTVVHLMTEMLEPKPGESIYDPTCGSAGMLLSAEQTLLNLIKCPKDVPRCKTEQGSKEEIAAVRQSKATTFPDGSIFRAIADRFIGFPFADDLLICDDLGTECADFVTANFERHQLALIHAKAGHGKKISASAFHDVVAQAMKNLVYLTRNSEVPDGVSSWSRKAKWNNTSIPRLYRFPENVPCSQRLWKRNKVRHHR